jgi:hypothetical protein
MATKGGGVFVRSLFKLLDFLGVSQVDVCRHLGLKPPVVNLWAKGQRPMPQRHLEAFEPFVWNALALKNDRYTEAMEQQLGEGCGGFITGDVAHEPLMFKPPPSDAPPVVQRWWAFHVRALQLMDEWDIELEQERHVETVEALCRQIGKVALDESDKLRTMIEGPERRQLLDWFTQGQELLQALERIDARPIATRLRRALNPEQGSPRRKERV